MPRLLLGLAGLVGMQALALAQSTVEGPAEGVTLRLTFAGDLMAHKPNWSMDDFDHIYHRVAGVLINDDLSFVNLETPVVEDLPWSTYPRFNVHRSYVEAALRAGFDVMSLANNHTYDMYSKGTRETLAAIKGMQGRQGKVVASGIRSPEEGPGAPFRMEYHDIKGVRIGFVAITTVHNYHRHDGMTYGLNLDDPEARKDFLAWLAQRDKGNDIMVVSIHHGLEYQRTPPPGFVTLARDMVANGVDVVWGHHPHVLQPWYVETGPDGRDRVVMPSMGNFISGQTWFLGPEDFRRERAWTGDSALMVLDLFMDLRPGHRSMQVVKVSPLLIGHFKLPGGGVAAWPYSKLTEDVPGAWQQYYQVRREVLEDFFPRSAGELAGMFPGPLRSMQSSSEE